MNDTRKATRFDRAAPALYLVLSWLLLLPFSARIGTLLPGPRVDTFQNLWNYWWVGRALPAGRSPFFTPELFYPYGADLSYHTLSLLNTVSAALCGNAISPVALLGFSLFLAYPIGAWGTYLLARELTGSRAGAFAAGFVYAFFPHHLDQIYSHLNLTSTHLLPFFLLFLVRLARRGAWKDALFAALFLALQSYGCLTYMMHGLFLLGAVAATALIRGGPPAGRRGAAARFGGVGLLFLLLATPLLVAPLRSASERGEFRYKKVRPKQSASVETLLSPSVFHPLFGKRVAEANRAYEHVPRGATAYLGFSMVALAAIGFLSRRRSMWPYAAGALAFLMLALGPHLQMRIGDESGLALPYSLMQKIPILRFLRVPNRFLVPASLCFAPLVAAGIGALVRTTRGRVVAFLLGALLFVEYLPPPIPSSPISPPAFAEKLEARDGAGAVFDVPQFFGSQATIYMYYQTLHGRPITSGYVSIPPPTQGLIAREDEAIGWLCDTAPGGAAAAPPGNPIAAFSRLGIGDVVLHKDFRAGMNRYAPPGMDWPEESDGGSWYWKYTTVTGSVSERRMRAFREKLEEWLGAPYFEDDRVALFAVPERIEP